MTRPRWTWRETGMQLMWAHPTEVAALCTLKRVVDRREWRAADGPEKQCLRKQRLLVQWQRARDGFVDWWTLIQRLSLLGRYYYYVMVSALHEN
jgi:hypothetical protein